MMTKSNQIDFRFLFLAAMLIFLPGVEALKNIFAFLFVISWILIAKKNNDWGGRWKVIDSIFLMWILADVIVSANAIITHQLPGGGVRDIIRFVLIGWALSRANFSKKVFLYLALASIVGTIFTLAYSYYSTGGVLKELHSVGHINHTAIFLVISYSISLSLFLFNFKNLNLSQKAFLIFAIIVLFLATVDSNSRATFGLIVFLTIIQFSYLLVRIKKTYLTIGFFGLLFCIGFLFIQNPPEPLQRIQSEGILPLDHSHRTKINNFSYYAFTKNPLLGIGFGNYSKLKIQDIQNLDSRLYSSASHAHNVFFNYLVSGGGLIFSIFIWFWFYIVWIIFKLRSTKENDWIVLSSISVLLINLGIGWVNTTFHHEHAILSMIVLGTLISEYRRAEHRKSLHLPYIRFRKLNMFKFFTKLANFFHAKRCKLFFLSN